MGRGDLAVTASTGYNDPQSQIVLGVERFSQNHEQAEKTGRVAVEQSISEQDQHIFQP